MTKFFMALTIATLFLANQAVIAKSAGSEWVLKQNSLDLGPLTVYIGDEAVKIECTKQGYCVLAKAPDWQVHCYRPTDKTIWETSMQDFNGILLSNPFSTSKYNKGTVHRVGLVNYSGVACSQFRPINEKSWIEFASDQISTNAKICEFINRYYYLPSTGQVPLYRKIEAPDHKRKLSNQWLTADITADLRVQPRVVLSTVDAKKMGYREADFEIPRNFKKVSDVNEISLSKNNKQQITDFADSLGFSTDFGEAEKPKH